MCSIKIAVKIGTVSFVEDIEFLEKSSFRHGIWIDSAKIKSKK